MSDLGASIFHDSEPSLYSIAPHRPFLQDLAAGIVNNVSGDPLKLADVTIFLPTRRAARSLTDAFLSQAGETPRATLLPRIRTLGDIEDADIPDISGFDLALDPPIPLIERRLVLANYIHRKNTSDVTARDNHSSWSTALSGADELASLIDAFYTEQISFDRLRDLVPDEYARHWQVTLDFLEIITRAWPDYLLSRRLLDPSDFRRRLIDKLCASWDTNGSGIAPKNPVIIAGSTGSMPAVSRLMRVVADLPNGCVVLPGLDHVMDDAAWQEIEDPHPQAGMKHLLEEDFDGFPRKSVGLWPTSGDRDERTDRQQLISLALRPAEATDDWLERLRFFKKRANTHQAVRGLVLIEAADESAEAQSISIALRGVLEDGGKTAILVTPDRTLARRVSTLMNRWEVQLDDSAGVPFANTLRGNFLRLVANWLVDPSEPVALLALMKHPLCAVGFDRGSHARRVQLLDLALRGLRPPAGIDGLASHLVSETEWDALAGDDAHRSAKQNKEHWSELKPLIDKLEAVAAPFQHCGDNVGDLLGAHLRVAEQLASTDAESGGIRLWSFEDGEAGATLLGSLLDQAALLPDIETRAYPDFFLSLIAATPVRFRRRQHARLMILGPLEARLQKADQVILAGLNEGVWPDEARTDSFLSRPMRKSLGLPSPEQRIGLSAHDFAQGACAHNVILTRSKRSGRSPAKPSRWLVRLKNILAATGDLEVVEQSDQYQYWLDQLDAPKKIISTPPPAPCPPVEVRPVEFSVTAVERLLRDPYSIYASKILRLSKLEQLNTDTNFAVRGRFYHHLFARFALEYSVAMPLDPTSVLSRYALELFEKAGVPPAIQAFWQARMHESFAWFIDFHAKALASGQPVVIEKTGAWKFTTDAQQYVLTARADRIDLYKDGLFIFDYKTGATPTRKQTKTFSPQLQLTGLIAQNGGFGNLPSNIVAGYGFLKALNRKRDDVLVTGDDVREDITEAEERLRMLLRHYENPSEPYLSQPRPFYQYEYGDYDHLARRAEWTVDRGEPES